MAGDSLLTTIMGNGKAHPEPAPSAVKALSWARVSTDMQEERGLSIPEQQKQIRVYAVNEGIEILEEFFEATSAFQTKARRPEFERMLQRAKADPEVSVILVHDFSRFSRERNRPAVH